jgi:dTMP kinase
MTMDDNRGTLAAGPLALSGALTATAHAGRFFVFEGIDGSGKSTIAEAFADRLMADGRSVVRTAEPTSTWLGDQVRRGNREARSDFAEMFLYVADRAEHSVHIAEWLKAGSTVVCDRYVGSTLAYQSVSLRPHLGGRALEWLKAVNEPVIVRPDATVLLRIEPEMAMDRIAGRKEREKFEQAEFLRKVASIYDRLAAEDPSYVVVDAAASPEEVLERVWEQVGKF